MRRTAVVRGWLRPRFPRITVRGRWCRLDCKETALNRPVAHCYARQITQGNGYGIKQKESTEVKSVLSFSPISHDTLFKIAPVKRIQQIFHFIAIFDIVVQHLPLIIDHARKCRCILRIFRIYIVHRPCRIILINEIYI